MPINTIFIDHYERHNINKSFDYSLKTSIQIFTEWKILLIFQWNVISILKISWNAWYQINGYSNDQCIIFFLNVIIVSIG